MSGVDGGSKLNILNAPSIKKTEAENSASSFVVKKTKAKKQVNVTSVEPEIEPERIEEDSLSNGVSVVEEASDTPLIVEDEPQIEEVENSSKNDDDTTLVGSIEL